MSQKRDTARQSGFVAVLAVALGGIGVLEARAGDTELRTFSVRIDNKPAGDYQMRITRRDDGSLELQGRANIKVSYFFITYRYSLNDTETWKDERLVKLSSTCNDDGKQFAVEATAAQDGSIQIRSNGRMTSGPGDAWTTTFWQLPNRLHNQRITLIDADTGKLIFAQLQFVAREDWGNDGKSRIWTHYRVTGGANAPELWYDAQRRLVRESFVEDGHRTLLELSAIGR
jgi:hypothetical protein